MLKLAGSVGLAGAFAGCSGENNNGGGGVTPTPGTTSGGGNETTGNGTDDDQNQGGGDLVDASFSSRFRNGITPNDAQWNFYNNQNKDWSSRWAVYDPMTIPTIGGEIHPAALSTEWQVTEETMTIKVREGLTWHDGEEVTAEQLAIKPKMQLHMGLQGSGFFDSVQATDDRTVELALSNPGSPDLLKQIVGSLVFDTPPEHFEQFVQQFEEASSDDETESIQGEVASYTIDEPRGTGIFKINDKSVGRLLLEKHEDHPDADNINFSEFELINWQGGQQWYDEMADDQFDIVTARAPNQPIADQFPEHMELVTQPALGGYAHLFNFNHPDLGKRKVRQALAWLHDPEQTIRASATPEGLSVPEYAMGHNFYDWTSETVRNNIHRYNQNVDTETATSLLKEEGYTQNNGQWYRPNGDRFSLGLWNQSEPTFELAFKNQLDEFGIKATVETKERSTWANEFFNNNFDVFTHLWGAPIPRIWHPWVQMQWEYVEEYVPAMGKPVEEYPVVQPVGDPEGSVEMMNIQETFYEWSREQDEQRSQELFDLLSWAWNTSCPCAQVYTSDMPLMMDTKDWNWPSEEGIKNGPPNFSMNGVHLGMVEAKTQ